MYCTKCGMEIEEDAEFCSYCGTKQIEEMQEPTLAKNVKKKEAKKSIFLRIIDMLGGLVGAVIELVITVVCVCGVLINLKDLTDSGGGDSHVVFVNPNEELMTSTLSSFKEDWYKKYTSFKEDGTDNILNIEHEDQYIKVTVNDMPLYACKDTEYTTMRDEGFAYNDTIGRGVLVYYPDDGNRLVIIEKDGTNHFYSPLDE